MREKRKTCAACLRVLLLAVCTWMLGITASASTGINVATHTADEIRQYIKSSGATLTDPVEYDVQPVLTAPYAAGQLSAGTLNSAIAILNQVRYIAGLNANVTLDAVYTEKVQAGALVNAVNKQLSHTPAQPSGMEDALYELGASGCGSANIAMGYSTLGQAIVHGWMADDDAGNIPMLGHRRWVLNPKMGKTGFGFVNRYSAMYSFDRSASASQYGVVWPAQMMPTDYFDAVYPWSVSMGTNVDISSVKVTLTRERDGKVWEFSKSSSDGYFNVNNEGYGEAGCIIFRPDGVGEYSAGDVFKVNITGLSSPVSYTVNFFDMVPVTSVTVDVDEVTVEEERFQKFNVTVLPENASSTIVKYSVEDEAIAEVTSSNYIEGKSAGTTQVTVSCGGKSTTFTVNVTHSDAHATCTEDGICSHCGYVVEEKLGHKPGKEATCTEDQICERCGDTLVKALGHVPGDEATCTEDQICERCKETLVKALGHKPGKEATCTEDQICERCGDTLVKALDHEPGAEATCTEDQTCVRCDYVFVPKLGHDYVETVVAPTETEQGYTLHVCSRCQDEYKDNYVPATGITEPEQSETNPGTSDEPGTEQNQPGTEQNQPGTSAGTPGTSGGTSTSGQPGTSAGTPGTSGGTSTSGQPGTEQNQPGTEQNQPGTSAGTPGTSGGTSTSGQPGTEQNQPGTSAGTPGTSGGTSTSGQPGTEQNQLGTSAGTPGTSGGTSTPGTSGGTSTPGTSGTQKPAANTGKVSKNATLASTLTSVKVSWRADQKATAGYRVYVKSGSKYVKVGTTKAGVTSLTIRKIGTKSLKAGTTYTVRVASLNKVSGKLKEGSKTTFTTATKSAAPKWTSVTRQLGTRAVLKWKKVKGVTGYEIQMSTKARTGYKTIGKVSALRISYTKTKLSKKSTYYFRIRTYKKVTGGYVYSAWSSIKTLKK